MRRFKEPPEEISIECPISYQNFPDTDRQRIISGKQMHCSNKKDGCTWKGKLKNLSVHINKGEREGGCQFEVVKCRYYLDISLVDGSYCTATMKRADLADHEEKKCRRRPYTCQYCGRKDTYREMHVGHNHDKKCPRYPVPCPNECDPKKTMPREKVKAHIKNCPLQRVACELCWAGCTARPQRKDIEQHITSNQIQHLTLLAKTCRKLNKVCGKLNTACGELSVRCDELSERCDELEEENAELKEELEETKYY